MNEIRKNIIINNDKIRSIKLKHNTQNLYTHASQKRNLDIQNEKREQTQTQQKIQTNIILKNIDSLNNFFEIKKLIIKSKDMYFNKEGLPIYKEGENMIVDFIFLTKKNFENLKLNVKIFNKNENKKLLNWNFDMCEILKKKVCNFKENELLEDKFEHKIPIIPKIQIFNGVKYAHIEILNNLKILGYVTFEFDTFYTK